MGRYKTDDIERQHEHKPRLSDKRVQVIVFILSSGLYSPPCSAGPSCHGDAIQLNRWREFACAQAVMGQRRFQVSVTTQRVF